MKLIEVILPIPLSGTFTYALPQRMDQEQLAGCRVIVPFGKRTVHTGIIKGVTDQSKAKYAVKEIIEVLDEQPVITTKQLEFQQWISAYYMCTLGEVYNAALPTGLKLTGESFVVLVPDVKIEFASLNDKEFTLIQFLEKAELSFEEVRQITGLKHPYRLIKKLSDDGLIYLYEKIKDKYTPKRETRIRLADQFVDEETLNDLATALDKKQKQLDVVLKYLELNDVLEFPEKNAVGITKSALIKADVSDTSLNTLVKNGIFVKWEQIIDRFAFGDHQQIIKLPQLSDIQSNALAKINTEFENHSCVLFRGITGSGKTEIYMHLIQRAIETGNTVLYLLPEIALTTQIIKRFRAYFGDRFGIYHSRFSDNERAEIYRNSLLGKYDFIIGVRSAVFLPFNTLSLIIVDEEHEPSYKQFEPAPRYHARDSATYLAQLHGAKVLLGSATPSLESYHNAQEGKYGYVLLDQRYDNQPLPSIEFADLTKARKQRTLKGNFANQLLDEIALSIAQKKQVILFQNRRGYAPYVQCDHCNHIPNCPNCTVSLTYHIYQNDLVCHYCGYRVAFEPSCESCQAHEVKTVGTGTEQIEEELGLLMPDLKISRMDLDTTRNKYSYQQLIDDFEEGNVQVLIGTQMISKGLDFEHVNLVGVFDADRMIHFPDFRSHERAFQLITQVSGRSGRKHEQGKVVVQTRDPNQPILQHIREGRLDLFYQQELAERENFRYPPYSRMINVVLRHKDKDVCRESATKFAFLIKKDLGEHRMMGPIEPVINRIRNHYIQEIVIKLEKQHINLAAVKQFLISSRDTLLALPTFKSVFVHFDVDPL